MALLTVNYCAYSRRGRRRSGTGAVQNIAPSLMVTAVTSTAASVSAFNISNYPAFAFWSITGEAAGARISTQRFETVAVGNDPLIATAWYLPSGSGGTGGPGIGIDAFDISRGAFFDDDFVTITSDAALTAGANSDGFVPTTNAETINASNPCYEFVAASNLNFDSWVIDDPNSVTHSGNLIWAAAGSNATAFAMYRAPGSLPIVLPPGRIYSGRGELHGVWFDGKFYGGWEFDPFGARLASPTARADVGEVLTGLKLNDLASTLTDGDMGAELRRLGLRLASDAINRMKEPDPRPDKPQTRRTK